MTSVITAKMWSKTAPRVYIMTHRISSRNMLITRTFSTIQQEPTKSTPTTEGESKQGDRVTFDQILKEMDPDVRMSFTQSHEFQQRKDYRRVELSEWDKEFGNLTDLPLTQEELRKIDMMEAAEQQFLLDAKKRKGTLTAAEEFKLRQGEKSQKLHKLADRSYATQTIKRVTIDALNPVRKPDAAKKSPFNLRNLAYLESITLMVWGALITFCIYSFTDGFNTEHIEKQLAIVYDRIKRRLSGETHEGESTWEDKKAKIGERFSNIFARMTGRGTPATPVIATGGGSGADDKAVSDALAPLVNELNRSDNSVEAMRGNSTKSNDSNNT